MTHFDSPAGRSEGHEGDATAAREQFARISIENFTYPEAIFQVKQTWTPPGSMRMFRLVRCGDALGGMRAGNRR